MKNAPGAKALKIEERVKLIKMVIQDVYAMSHGWNAVTKIES